MPRIISHTKENKPGDKLNVDVCIQGHGIHYQSIFILVVSWLIIPYQSSVVKIVFTRDRLSVFVNDPREPWKLPQE